jgi:general stress protein 26
MHHNHRDHEGAQKLYELIKDVKICMMTTVEPDGSLHSRPMYNQEADEAGDLWFFTRLQSPKVTEISKDGQVNLGFSNPSKQDYVSVSGKAVIVRDRARIDEKWSEPLKAWFPDGKDDPNIALIRVHPGERRILGQPVFDAAAHLRLRQGRPHGLFADRDDRSEEGQPALTGRFWCGRLVPMEDAAACSRRRFRMGYRSLPPGERRPEIWKGR